MIVYFDTSAFLPLLIDEPGTPISLRLWGDAAQVTSSRLIVTESAAALAQGVRMGRVPEAEHTEIQSDCTRLVRELTLLDVSAAVLDDAAELAAARQLRSLDAIHLASASLVFGRALVLASGDRALLRAAAGEGFTVVDTRG